MSTESQVNRYDRYIQGLLSGRPETCLGYDYRDKPRAISQHINYMLNRTRSMFRWNGLPDSIPERILELYLQSNGNVCWCPVDGKLYIFTGGLGGEWDVYYRPTIYTVANPALNFYKNLKIDVDCVVMYNDSLRMGLLPLFEKYATALTETELSLDIANINSRIVDLISASDDTTKESALKFLEDVRNGKPGVIGENAFFDGVRGQPYGTTGNRVITDLIELLQYFKASWWNDVGLNANYNMKRESLNSAESQLNNDALLPLADDLLKMRQEGAKEVSEKFAEYLDGEITVEYASAWEDNEIELEEEQNNLSERSETDPTGEEAKTDDPQEETE